MALAAAPPGAVATSSPASDPLPSPASDPAAYVDPFIGTGGNGHTFPGAVVPFGLVQLSPDTGGTEGNWLSSGWKWCAGYHYSDTTILGFSHTHRSGMGVGDWGDILVTATTGPLRVTPGSADAPGSGYRSSYSHADEVAQPGYYSVVLKDYGVKAELTATTRVGLHRYTFPASAAAHILFDLDRGLGDTTVGSSVRVVGNDRLEGYRRSTGFVADHTVYFSAQFSRPFDSFGTWKGGRVKPGSREASGRGVGAYLDFATAAGDQVLVKVGLSYTSVEEARRNLEAEVAGWDFDLVRSQARAAWDRELGRIEVTPAAGSSDPRVVFYTALYHCLLFPAVFSDADGTYTALGNQPGDTRRAQGFTYYSDFSLWDTYRAEMPLLSLLEPDRVRDMVKTMLAQYEDSGWLPAPQQFGNFSTGDMIGDSAASVILGAYLNGVRGFDLEEAYRALWKNAMVEGSDVLPGLIFGQGRYGIRTYRALGYLPGDLNPGPRNPLFVVGNIFNEGTSRTLEYAYDDFCLACLAKLLGKESDFRYFLGRALNWRNVFDPAVGFARGRSVTGGWLNRSGFDPTVQYAYYTEGNAWQWTWSVPHDVGGLVRLMGGREAFVRKLDQMFEARGGPQSAAFYSADIAGLIGQYAHGNEPSHHVAYLYDYAGRPDKTQARVRQILAELYRAAPDGLCGNDDMGQMSAWYVFSALGFYPVSPGVYAVGSPIFARAVIHLPGAAGEDPAAGSKAGRTGSGAGADSADRTLTIEARGVSSAARYIQAAVLDGRPLDRPWLSSREAATGGTLVLQMGSEPSPAWGTDPAAAPPSLFDLATAVTAEAVK